MLRSVELPQVSHNMLRGSQGGGEAHGQWNSVSRRCTREYASQRALSSITSLPAFGIRYGASSSRMTRLTQLSWRRHDRESADRGIDAGAGSQGAFAWPAARPISKICKGTQRRQTGRTSRGDFHSSTESSHATCRRSPEGTLCPRDLRTLPVRANIESTRRFN